MCKKSILKTTKYCWWKLNGGKYYVYFSGRLNLVKMTAISKLINRFHEIPISLQICILWTLTQSFKNTFGNVEQIKKQENIEDSKIGGITQYIYPDICNYL